MVPQWIIEAKRDGGVLDPGDIRAFVAGFADGSIPDYQMAALAMAIYLNGMTPEETAALTEAILDSGDRLDTSGLDAPVADKHSTGGIGDKVSLVLAPLAACAGLAVPMISGRGLGITGGTLDKLESIPGFRTDLDLPELLEVVGACGCAIIGQTDRLAPADRKLYALRDVTATVPSIPLITASIMGKKLAEGLDVLVLDVKFGRGAFMGDADRAQELARSMIAVGGRMGVNVSALLTAMDQPLGRAAGNAVEVRECVDALQGRGPEDLMEVTLALTADMLVLAGRADSAEAARAELRDHLDSGRAWARFQDMVRRQGGDPDALTRKGGLPEAPAQEPLPAPRSGTVARADAQAIGKAVLLLGAGRRKTTDRVDHAVGITDLVKIGEAVTEGQPLLTVHRREGGGWEEARALLEDAFEIVDGPVTAPPLLADRLDAES